MFCKKSEANIFKQLDKILSSGKVIAGLGDGEKVALLQKFDHLLFLCSNYPSAGKIKRALEGFGKKIEIISCAREVEDENDKNLLPFAQGVNKYLSGQLDGLIFLPSSAMIKFDKSKFEPIILNKNGTADIDTFSQKLASLGYERVSLVEEAGQFAVRGEIVDIFLTTLDAPVRIEFFDDLIEKISTFEVSTMKNKGQMEKLEIFSASLPIGKDDVFTLDGVKIMDEPKKVMEEIELLKHSYQAMSIYKPSLYAEFEDLYERADYLFDNFDIAPVSYKNEKIPPRSYLTDFMALKQDILDFKNLNQAIILFTGEERFLKNMQEFLNENNLAWHDYDESINLISGEIYLSPLAMPLSFCFLKEGLTAIGADSLFRSKNSGFSRGKHAVFYLPKLGDYVVHAFHGVGKCIAIERMKISNIEKDYFVIEYKNGDRLYLPSEEANSISAYIGAETQPKLSSLGGAEFARLKDRVRASIHEMAISLVEVYKERSLVKGYAFKRDEYLEKKFADAFPYTETEDQLKAINDIDKDMESDKVMDRLICGDVGYGKTEVALRACFKCVYNGKQVALLCPTTILSEQHYRSAKERLAPFGVRVEVLNRFKTPLQVKDILRRVQEGEVDMVIGTHRILSSDVIYHDLGLLVLDEEQRFGVEHKEKLKDAHRNIDVLTFSATPIPRTLNMSLSGIRDISIIETPPRDRLPIQTYIAEQSDDLLRDVISRELARGGQAFVVYNRVETIEEFACHLRTLLPDAKVGIAHGQMNEKVLENVIQRLYNGEYNVLVASTLIENGINLPFANTMVIIEADRLGLSQLYQLRGRIGRSDKLSYAYLTYVKDKKLTDEGYERLEAMKEFSALGSGFKIAMRDLEIRGAGNIFGREQHGHIAKVGYDMYVKLLDEEVKALRGEKVYKKSDVKLEVVLSAFVSEDYIEDSEQRIALYTKISSLTTQKEMQSLLESISDGYGEAPNEVKNLCMLALMRNEASEFNVERIKITKLECYIVLKKTENIIDKTLAEVASSQGGKLVISNDIRIKFVPSQNVLKDVKMLTEMFEKAINLRKN